VVKFLTPSFTTLVHTELRKSKLTPPDVRNNLKQQQAISSHYIIGQHYFTRACCYHLHQLLFLRNPRNISIAEMDQITPSPSLSHAVSFLPYIWHHVSSSSSANAELVSNIINDQQLRVDALDYSISDLSILLRLPSDVFWSTILWPKTQGRDQKEGFLTFLDEYLKYHLDLETWSRPPFLEHSDIFKAQATSQPTLSPHEIALEGNLAQKVFQVICRMAFELSRVKPSLSSSNPGSWMLLEKNGKGVKIDPVEPIFTIARLIDVCRIFAHTNLDAMERICDSVLECCPWLIEDMEAAELLVEDVVHGIQKKLEKMVSRQRQGQVMNSVNQGKGKGKGKASAATDDALDGWSSKVVESGGGGSSGASGANKRPSDAPSTVVKDGYTAGFSTPLVDIVFGIHHKEIALELGYLVDAALSFEALAFAGKSRIADTILHQPTFISSLIGSYDVANIVRSLIAESQPGGHSSASGLGSTLPNELALLLSLSQQLKLATIGLLEVLIANAYLDPLGLQALKTTSLYQEAVHVEPFTKPSSTNRSSADHDDDQQRSNSLCDLIIRLLESSQFDGPVKFLQDAPLLIDLDVDWGLGELLHILRDKKRDIDGSEDARIEYLVLSLEQMLTFSGNADARRLVLNKKLQRKAELEAKFASSGASAGLHLPESIHLVSPAAQV
jgi:hypothetical protein